MFAKPTHTSRTNIPETNYRTHVGWRKRSEMEKRYTWFRHKQRSIFSYPQKRHQRKSEHRAKPCIYFYVLFTVRGPVLQDGSSCKPILLISPNIILCACPRKSRKTMQPETCMCLSWFENIYVLSCWLMCVWNVISLSLTSEPCVSNTCFWRHTVIHKHNQWQLEVWAYTYTYTYTYKQTHHFA